MANYKELTKRQLLVSETGQQGVRIFIDETGGPDTLPSIGDAYDGTYTSCLARNIDKTNFGGLPNTYIYTVNYSTEASPIPPSAGDYDETTAFADLPRSLSTSTEMLRMIKPDDATFSGSGDVVDSGVTKKIGMITLTIPKVFTSMTTLITRIAAVQGKVNHTSFEGQDGEVWLFAGCRATEFIDSSSTKKWRAFISFTARRVTGSTGDGNDGWNYRYNINATAWQKVVPAPYGTVDFSTIFA